MRGAQFALCIALLATAGCRPSFKQADSGHVRIAITTRPVSIDPAKATTQVTQEMARQEFQTLVRVTPSGAIEGDLAQDWKWSADRMTVTFRVRECVFSDSSPLRMVDIRDSFVRTCNRATASGEILTYIGDILGAKECNSGARLDINGISINERERTIAFRIAKPSQSFVARISHTMCSVCKLFNSRIIGTGPYKLDSFVDGEKYIYSPNPYYKGPIRNSGIEFRVVEDAATRLNLARTGQLDICPLGLGDLSADPGSGFILQKTAKAAVAFVQLNDKALPILASHKLRQSLAEAIDKDWLTSKIMGSASIAAAGLIPPGVRGYRRDGVGFTYSPDMAKRAISDMKLPKLQLFYGDKVRLGRIAEAVVSCWRRTLGVDAEAIYMQSGALLAKNEKGEVPIYLTGWTGDFPDPENFVASILDSRSSTKKSGIDDVETNRLIDLAKNSGEENRWVVAEKRGLGIGWVIPLFHQTDCEFVAKRISGSVMTPWGRPILCNVVARKKD